MFSVHDYCEIHPRPSQFSPIYTCEFWGTHMWSCTRGIWSRVGRCYPMVKGVVVDDCGTVILLILQNTTLITLHNLLKFTCAIKIYCVVYYANGFECSSLSIHWLLDCPFPSRLTGFREWGISGRSKHRLNSAFVLERTESPRRLKKNNFLLSI